VFLNQLVPGFGTGEHDASGARGFDDQLVAWPEPGAAKRIDGDRCLVLAGDASVAAEAGIPYLCLWRAKVTYP